MAPEQQNGTGDVSNVLASPRSPSAEVESEMDPGPREQQPDLPIATAEDLRNTAKFRFKTETLPIPEVGVSLVLRSLSIRQREDLPDIDPEADVTTEETIAKLAETFSIIVHQPKVTAEEAQVFLGDWPAEALDRLMVAYVQMQGSKEEEAVAYGAFPARGAGEVEVPAGS